MFLNMQFILPLFFITLVMTLANGKPLDSEKNAQILKYENSIEPDGVYRYSFETSDGIVKEEKGTFRMDLGKDSVPVLVVEGFYSYYDDKGEKHEVNYIADDAGYRIITKKVDFKQIPTLSTPPPPMDNLLYSSPVRHHINPSVLASLVGSGVGK